MVAGIDPWFVIPGFSCGPGEIYILMRIDCSVGTILQVFHRSKAEHFSSERQHSRNVPEGVSSQLFRISSADRIEAIRVDPSNREGAFRILSLEIFR